MLKRFSKVINGSELEFTCSFTSLLEGLDKINDRLEKLTPTEKVIMLRCTLCAYLYFGEKKPNEYTEVGVFYNDKYYVSRVYREGLLQFFATPKSEGINAPIYKENNYDKFDLPKILKGKPLLVGSDSGGRVMVSMEDGGIGYDFLKVVRNEDSLASGVFGAIGVSTQNGHVINASGFLIKSYVSDENINKMFKDITEQIYPSRDLFKIDDFFNKFKIKPNELSLDLEIKTI